MDIITSRNNPLIVETAKLKDKKHRENKKSFLFEGIKLTREAISSGVDIEHIFLTEKCAEKYPDIASRENSILISDSVCQKLSENSAPEGIICTAKYLDNLHKKYDTADSRSRKHGNDSKNFGGSRKNDTYYFKRQRRYIQSENLTSINGCYFQNIHIQNRRFM